MTRVKPGQRQRAKAPKVRTGCITCKYEYDTLRNARRVKCDEAKPYCLKCTSSGRTCGYVLPPTLPPSSSQMAVAARYYYTSGNSQGLFLPPPVPASLSARLSQSPHELRSLQFFMEKTIPQFTSFFPDTLWNNLILRLAHSETSIQHALLALSSFHERFLRPKPGEVDSSFALSQYNKAIKGLISTSQSPSAVVINLASCLIFFCIETLKKESASAIRIFKFGRRLIHEWCNQGGGTTKQPQMVEEVRSIDGILLRLAVQISEFVGHSDPALSMELIHDFDFRLPVHPIAPSFTSLCEAREAVLGLFVEFQKAQAQWGEKYDSYSVALKQWSAAFNLFLESRAREVPFSNSEKKSIALLRLYEKYCISVLIAFDTLYSQGPPGFDSLSGSFMEIVDLSAISLDLDPQDEVSWPPQQPGEPQFHLEVGVIVILLGVVIMCRDPFVRRKAIRVMEYAPYQEGIWNRDLALRVAGRIVALEEFDLGDIQSARDVPEESRIRIMGMTLHPEERQATFNCQTLSRHWQEIITW